MWPFKKENKSVEKITNQFDDMEFKNAVEGTVVNNPVLDGSSSFVNYLQNNDQWKLSFEKIDEYYERCEPMTDAVDIISQRVAELPPILIDKRTKEEVEGHQVIKDLNYPDDGKTYYDLARDAISFLQISGSPFLRIDGDFDKPPASIEAIRPNGTRIEPNLTGKIGQIFLDDEFNSTVFDETPTSAGTRYRNNFMSELWPIFNFNSKKGTRHFYGLPVCQPLFYQIEHLLAGGLHNKSLLENGTKSSGAFHTDGNTPRLSPDQFKRMQQQIVDNYTGPSNAGKPLLLEWVKYQQFLVNNQDMDYAKLMEDARTAIFRRYNIPLPLVEPVSQKFSNFSSAQEALYLMGVLPVANFWYGQLTTALMYRYEKDWENYEITCDVSKIAALEGSRIATVLERSKIGVNTVNELRKLLNDLEMKGGDVILRKSNEVPALDDDEDAE